MRNDLYLKELGCKVKAFRKAQGITVRQLGEMCQTDYSNLSRFENGQVNITILSLKMIAEKLNIELKDILQ